MRRVFSIWLVLFSVVALAGCCSTIASDGGDDGWRRTAHGWEQLAVDRDVPFSGTAIASAPRKPAANIRWDIHPAALTLAQTLAVLAAMAAFPRPKVVRLAWLQEDWRGFLRRSFRASVFGS
jgi:hypothetical protein